MHKREALFGIVGGVGVLIVVQVTVAPPGTPPGLAPLLSSISAAAVIAGAFGLVPLGRVSGFIVDGHAYAAALSSEAQAFDIARLPFLRPTLVDRQDQSVEVSELAGRLVIEGGQGAGKSRLAIDTAKNWLNAGRRGLYIRLAGWNTSVDNLVVRTLSAAAGRSVGIEVLHAYLSGAAFVIFDSIDEVPIGSRNAVATEIVQFSLSHPSVDVLIMARPSTSPSTFDDWTHLRLRPLDSTQIDQVLGEHAAQLSLLPAVRSLASNPLMLGLLRTEVQAGRIPNNESSLLDSFVGQLVTRQAARDIRVDKVAGWRIAEDMAWNWLAGGRIGIADVQFRSLASTVSQALRVEGFLTFDALELERWTIELGLAAFAQGQVLPVHRAVLDHLAGRALPRRESDPSLAQPEFREPIARYVGSVPAVDGVIDRSIESRGTDLEFLARCAFLVHRDIKWPYSAEEFARRYLAELRRLANGPLSGLGVIPAAARVEIDREITWVYELSGSSVAVDEVSVVEQPARMFIQAPGGLAIPVHGFQMAGQRGQELEAKVPELAAYDRAKSELLRRLGSRTLLNEGPDLTYQRLCRYSVELRRLVSMVQGHEPVEFARSGSYLTTEELVNALLRWLTASTRTPFQQEALANTMITWVPSSGLVVLTNVEPSDEDPYDVKQGRQGFAVHCMPLVLLAARASKFGISNLPLHPIGLLPESISDPVLLLPEWPQGLDHEQACLFVVRHEIGELRSLRYLVENNFAGLASRIGSYSSLPWRVTIKVNFGDPSATKGWDVKGRIERNAVRDEVVLGDDVDDGALTFGRSMITYQPSSSGAYMSILRDMTELLAGQYALGSQEL